MIRFIDLRHVAEDIGERFAFWDTVTDRFIADDMGCQAWETIGQFALGYSGDEIQRFVGLTPEWAKYAPADREVFRVEVIPATSSSVAQAFARNEDGSAGCRIPLSPVVLEALRGRPLVYFWGKQVLTVDEAVGAIEGQIVIDFDDEVTGGKEPTW